MIGRLGVGAGDGDRRGRDRAFDFDIQNACGGAGRSNRRGGRDDGQKGDNTQEAAKTHQKEISGGIWGAATVTVGISSTNSPS